MRDSVRQLVSGVVTALLLAVTSVACGGDFVTYYHSDVVGSPVAATDEQGRLMWRSQYRPYGGRIQSATDVAASANTSRWYGAYVDEGDGALIYMGGRYYDPSIGRFMGTDAQGFHIANVQSFGRYTYANNNPFSFKDPDGELPILVGVAVYGAGKAALENIAIQTAELGLGLRDEFSLSELAVDAAVGGISGGQASTVKNGARAVRIAEGVAKQAKQTERIAQNAKQGGRYEDLIADGAHRHHMPSKQASPLAEADGPAIRMSPADHRRTASYGGGPDSPQQAYRDKQRQLISEGRFDDAFLMDVDDIQSKFGNKYDDAILEAIDALPWWGE